MPIAVPIVAAPVAPPVNLAAPVSATVQTPIMPTNQVPEVRLDTGTATDETVMVAPGTSTELEAAGDLFSLFAGGEEPSTTEQPTAAPITPVTPAPESEAAPDFNFAELAVTEPTVAIVPQPETILFEPAGAPSRGTDTNNTAVSEVAVSQPTPAKPTSVGSSPFQAIKLNKNVMYAAIAGVAVLVLGGIGWWRTRGTSDDGSVSKSKEKSNKSVASGTATNTKAIDAHEVTLHVGAGGEFKSIGRALHSAVEAKAEYEAAAKGKPLRFLISVKPGPPFEESVVFDESIPGEVHLLSEVSGKNIAFKPPGDEPAITIKNLRGVTIENVFIDLEGFPPKDTGIVVSGSAARCRIKNSIISKAGKSGIELRNAVGGEGTNSITIDGITFQNSAPTAFGVNVVKPADGAATQHVSVQHCRFIGSMAAAVFLDGSVDSLVMRNCGVSGTSSGVRFAAGVIAKNVLIDHCSFRNQTEAGLLFDAMPGDGSGDFKWRNCLFAGLKKAELLIAKGYEPEKFNALMSADKPVENNWSDRSAAKAVSGERDLFGSGGQRVPAIQFASTSPSSELFLVPKPGEPYKTAGVKAK